MPPRLIEYGISDWASLRPLLHALKTAKYKAVDRRYRRQPPRAGDATQLAALVHKRRVLTTIAFNDPQTIAWQASLVAHFVDDVTYIIADNSTDETAAGSIAAFAMAQHIPYLRLPKNPMAEPSRSHGLALNWVWANVIRPGRPRYFGFLDDDIYPTSPDDPFAALSEQMFYGVVRPSAFAGDPRWFLWAGFCMFDFAKVARLDLDFSQDWFSGLDTGGGNWRPLYSGFDRFSLREQPTKFVPFREGLTMEEAPLQWCGAWLHSVGLMGRPDHAAEKAQVVRDILDPALRAAAMGPRGLS